MTTIFLNGLVKDYDPPGGIDAATDIHLDPLSQDWTAGTSFACPQGFSPGISFPNVAHTLNMPADGGIPITGTDRGTWVTGTNYAKYDKAVDPFNSLQYVATNAITPSTVAPHSAGSAWLLATWNGFSPRSRDAGFYGSTRAAGDASRWFSCECRKSGVSGSSEPVISGSGNAVDGTCYWQRVPNFKGAWSATTAYSANDYIAEDGSFWRNVGGGTSGSSEPIWTNVLSYGNTIDDGGGAFVWQRRYIDQGETWATGTTYGFRVVQGRLVTQGGNDVRATGVRLSDGVSFVFFVAPVGTDGVTGGTEPAWSSAASGSLWEDGTLIWRFGTFAVNDPSLQKERLVLSGLKQPSANGKTVTIYNDASAGTLRDVVLADKAGLDGSGAANLPGTDKASIIGFDFGGTNIPLAEGQSQTVVYNAGAGTWQVPGTPSATPIARRTIYF